MECLLLKFIDTYAKFLVICKNIDFMIMVGKHKNTRKRKKHGFVEVAILLYIGKVLMAFLSRLEAPYP